MPKCEDCKKTFSTKSALDKHECNNNSGVKKEVDDWNALDSGGAVTYDTISSKNQTIDNIFADDKLKIVNFSDTSVVSGLFGEKAKNDATLAEKAKDMVFNAYKSACKGEKLKNNDQKIGFVVQAYRYSKTISGVATILTSTELQVGAAKCAEYHMYEKIKAHLRERVMIMVFQTVAPCKLCLKKYYRLAVKNKSIIMVRYDDKYEGLPANGVFIFAPAGKIILIN